MNVNRSGYYKWILRKDYPNRYEVDRRLLTELILEQHEKRRSYGYHRLAALVRNQTGWIFSDNLAHKCCKYAQIKSLARKYRYQKSGEEHVLFPNMVTGNWNASKPMELIASDMTCLRHRGKLYEWTYFLDTFNNEIITSSISSKQGDARPYFNCLKQFLKKIEEQNTPVILHTDQGGVYSSKAFLNAHKDYTIIRSMSRAGTPTDNPVIEAINGWIKDEIKTDFNFNEVNSVSRFLKDYIFYFNNQRPASALKYKTPIQYKTELGFG
jgi:transposase InsO family protein